MNDIDEEDSSALRAIKKLKRDMSGVLLDALEDPDTVEILLNPDGSLWQEKLGEGLKVIGKLSVGKAKAIIETVAGYHNKEVTRKKPILEAELPIDGSRFAAVLSPIVERPSFAIRKKAIKIYTLEQYVESGIMSLIQLNIIKEAVENHRNILVIGGTGSGKTTLVNAIIAEMVNVNPLERILIVEDTNEIQCLAENNVIYHTSLEVSMTDILKLILRKRPDRILVGEVRGGEALDLMRAWNSGHEGGGCTLHANNAKAGLAKLEMLISMNKEAPRYIPSMIIEANPIIVSIKRHEAAAGIKTRKVEEILSLVGYDKNNSEYITLKLG